MLGTTLYFEVIIIRLHHALHLYPVTGYNFLMQMQQLSQFYFHFHFRNLKRNQTVLLTHGDSVNTLGEQLDVMGFTSNQIVAALSCEQLKIYGVQFHPEVRYYNEFYLQFIVSNVATNYFSALLSPFSYGSEFIKLCQKWKLLVKALNLIIVK